MVDHLGACVEADQGGSRITCQYALGRLAGARSQLEHAPSVRPGGSGGLVLEAFVAGHLLAHQREIAVRIPVELRHHPEKLSRRPSDEFGAARRSYLSSS